MIIEIHCHTEDSDCSSITLKQLIEKALTYKIEGLCITDHNKYPDLDNLKKYEDEYGIKLFPGIEWGLDCGHFLIFGLHLIDKMELKKIFQETIKYIEKYPDNKVPVNYLPESSEYKYILTKEYFPDTIEDLAFYVKDKKGCIIWAHPFDNTSLLRQIFNQFVKDCNSIDVKEFDAYLQKNKAYMKLYNFLKNIDGLEIRNGFKFQTGLESYFAGQLAEHFNLAKIGGSDIHSKKMIASYVMDFEEDIQSIEQLMKVLKSRKGYKILDKMGLNSRNSRTRILDP